MRKLQKIAVLAASVFLAANVFDSKAWSQCSSSIPNAIGIWRSDSFAFTNFVIPPPTSPYLAGTLGHRAWQILPAELCTYFRCGGARKRELDFRGVEFNVTYTSSFGPFDTPDVLITDNLIPVPGTLTRSAPSPLAIGLKFLGVPAAIPAGPPGLIYRIAYNKLGPAFVVAPGTLGIAFVWEDYETQFGSGNSLQMVMTTTEPAITLTDADNSFSGYTPSLGIPAIVPNVGPVSSEFCITWLFEQSMVQPIKNAKLATIFDVLPGLGVYPFGFHVIADDGRGALFPFTGDVVSYSANSNRGYPATRAATSNHWVVPFVLFSGDIPSFGSVDPLPEAWSTGTRNFIYQEKVSKWIDDFIVLSGGSAGSGVIYSPNGCNYGLWLGVDLPTFINITVLINSVNYADVSAGPQWAGPEVCVYDSIINPGGIFSRNLVNMAGSPYAPPFLGLGVREHRTLLHAPQAGYSPLVTVPGTGGRLGFGQVPLSLFPETFSIQCWVYSGSGTIVDTTNVAVTRLQ